MDVSSREAAGPRISLVLVSYNQARYLEEAIRSVLLQKHHNLELFVMDGGSTDGSTEVIRKYESFLDGWVSEPDRGQSDALNKGFSRCTGEILNWLCSDDLHLPGTFRAVSGHFQKHPETNVLAGAAIYRHEDGSRQDYVKKCSLEDLGFLPAQNRLVQPSCFFRRSLLNRAKPLQEDLHYTMDWELWCYFLHQKAPWAFTDDVLSVYRVTGTNKAYAGGRKILGEVKRIYAEYSGDRIPLTFWMGGFWRPLDRAARKVRPACFRRLFSLPASAVAALLRRTYPRARVQGLQTAFTWYDV